MRQEFSTVKNNFSKYLLLFLLPFILLSCQGKIGFGVVLWSPDDEKLANGTLVVVLSESKISNSYMIKLPDSKEKMELPLWRIEFFEKEIEAQGYQQNYAPWVEYYATNQKRALPMRSEPDNLENNTIYKLEDGQKVKVISRQEDKIVIAGLEGYWYQLLTEDGVQGWCFDYYLQVYTMGGDEINILENNQGNQDPFLEKIYQQQYYPTDFEDMIVSGTISLNRMNPDYYFDIDPENQMIRIRTQDHFLESNYDSVASTKFHTYNFIGSSFSIEAYSENRLSVQFNIEGTEYKEGMVTLRKPVQDYIDSEIQRRQALADKFISEDTIFLSDTYGELDFFDNNRFFWQNKSILISRNILSAQAGNEGSISFQNFLDSSLKSKYDGVITFSFQNNENLNFLIQWKNNGVLLLYVPENHIEKGIIKTDSFMNPLQIFFQKELKEPDTEEEPEV